MYSNYNSINQKFTLESIYITLYCHYTYKLWIIWWIQCVVLRGFFIIFSEGRNFKYSQPHVYSLFLGFKLLILMFMFNKLRKFEQYTSCVMVVYTYYTVAFFFRCIRFLFIVIVVDDMVFEVILKKTSYDFTVYIIMHFNCSIKYV